MAAVPVSELATQIAQLRDNPSIPREKGNRQSLADLQATMAGVRAGLIEAIQSASDGAFEKQPENGDGEEVWSVGEVVGHCNEAMINIGSSALEQIGIEAGEPPHDLKATAEPGLMTRGEALAAARVASVDDFYASIPDDDRLDNSRDFDFFGEMSGRSWLYFMALHEAEHVEQIKALG